ncbi:hypothetical protein HDU67_010276 [Dinochytrium kinnereticum]|nr:hypothetical protein HDU67_010276 [Dinochytrium kinnereticum]
MPRLGLVPSTDPWPKPPTAKHRRRKSTAIPPTVIGRRLNQMNRPRSDDIDLLAAAIPPTRGKDASKKKRPHAVRDLEEMNGVERKAERIGSTRQLDLPLLLPALPALPQRTASKHVPLMTPVPPTHKQDASKPTPSRLYRRNAPTGGRLAPLEGIFRGAEGERELVGRFEGLSLGSGGERDDSRVELASLGEISKAADGFIGDGVDDGSKVFVRKTQRSHLDLTLTAASREEGATFYTIDKQVEGNLIATEPVTNADEKPTTVSKTNQESPHQQDITPTTISTSNPATTPPSIPPTQASTPAPPIPIILRLPNGTRRTITSTSAQPLSDLIRESIGDHRDHRYCIFTQVWTGEGETGGLSSSLRRIDGEMVTAEEVFGMKGGVVFVEEKKG